MAELIAIAFDDFNEADRALNKLTQLQKEYLVDLEDAVIVLRFEDGKIKLKQSVNTVGIGAASGGLSGALWGSLVGLLFLNPLAGFAFGGLIGMGAGALSGSMVDYGIDDNFIRSLSDKMAPNSSALFVLVRKVQPEKVLKEFEGFHGHILRTSISPEQEAKLQEVLSKGATPPPVPGTVPASDSATPAPGAQATPSVLPG